MEDCDGLLSPGDRDNSHALKYIRRVTDKRNLKASNELFRELVEEIHRRGMKVILTGYLTTVDLLINGWTENGSMKIRKDTCEKGAYISADSPYRSFFCFQDQNVLHNITHHDGWWTHDTLPKPNI